MTVAQSIQLRDIHPFDPLARPRRFAEEGKAGFDARIVEETAHRQAPAQLSPPMAFDEDGHNRLQRHAMQWIAGMGDGR